MTIEEMNNKIDEFIQDNWGFGNQEGEKMWYRLCNLRDDDYEGIKALYETIIETEPGCNPRRKVGDICNEGKSEVLRL